MANNHWLEYGRVGLHESLAAAKRPASPWSSRAGRRGGHAPYHARIRGQRISSSVRPRCSPVADQGAPRLLHVVVYIHWGVVLDSCPPPSSARSPARKLVASGADVVAEATVTSFSVPVECSPA